MRSMGPASGVERVGVLVMAHGTPGSPSDLPAFYTRIRRGNPPSADQLADLRRRYDAIGGTSPLARRTMAQVDGLRHELELAAPGRYVVAFGAKHTEPFIETAAVELAGTGASPVIGLVLTPHPSAAGSGEYLRRAGESLAGTAASPPFVAVDHWYEAPAFVRVLGEGVRASLAALAGRAPGRCPVLFTAHSVPRRLVDGGDRYPEHVERSASLVAEAAGIGDWRVAWQSAGRTPEPWVGPDLLATLRGLRAEGVGSVLVCPVGFVSDHLEVLYDLDIEARGVAEEAGLVFARTPSVNDDPRFLRALADVVRNADPGLAHAVRAGHAVHAVRAEHAGHAERAERGGHAEHAMHAERDRSGPGGGR